MEYKVPETKAVKVPPKKEFRGERKLPKRGTPRPPSPPEVTEVRSRSEGMKRKSVKVAKKVHPPKPVSLDQFVFL